MTIPTPDQATPHAVAVTPAPLDALFADAALVPAVDVAEAAESAVDVVDDAAQADDDAVAATDGAPAPAPDAGADLAAATESTPDHGPHPAIAKRVIFDGNSFDIPCGTPAVILHDNNALRRAYATAMARPELTQAQMDDGTTEIDGYAVPTLTLRVRPQVKGAAPAAAPSLTGLLQRVPARSTDRGMSPLLTQLLRGRGVTCAQAVRAKLGDQIEAVLHPTHTPTYGGLELCTLLDMLPSDADAAPTDAAASPSVR